MQRSQGAWGGLWRMAGGSPGEWGRESPAGRGGSERTSHQVGERPPWGSLFGLYSVRVTIKSEGEPGASADNKHPMRQEHRGEGRLGLETGREEPGNPTLSPRETCPVGRQPPPGLLQAPAARPCPLLPDCSHICFLTDFLYLGSLVLPLSLLPPGFTGVAHQGNCWKEDEGETQNGGRSLRASQG